MLLGIVIAIVVPAGQGLAAGAVVASSGGFAVWCAYVEWACRRRIKPAVEVMNFAGDRHAQRWQAIDGLAVVPVTLDAALNRLQGRDDDTATTLRLSSYWRFGELDALRSGLYVWQPADRASLAAKARLGSRLAFLGGVDDLSEARTAAALIPDLDARRAEDAWIAAEESRRATLLGQDPLAPLARARPGLGEIRLPVLGPAIRRQQRRRLLALGIALLYMPVLVVVAPPARWFSSPLLDPILQSTSTFGLLVTDDESVSPQAIHLLEGAVESSTITDGPLTTAALADLRDASTMAGICATGGIAAPRSFPLPTIDCIELLVSTDQRGPRDRALLTFQTPQGGAPSLQPGVVGSRDGAIYLVALPAGTTERLLNLVKPNRYFFDGGTFRAGPGIRFSTRGMADIWPRIDAALPTAVLVSGPMSEADVAALTASELPAVEWLPRDRVTNVPPGGPGLPVHSVLVLGGSTTGEAIVTFDSETGPAYLYRLDPTLAAIARSAFTAASPSP